VLNVLPYDDKNLDVVVPPDPLIVGTPATLPDHGETW